MNTCHLCGDSFKGERNSELCPGCEKEIEAIKRDRAFERELDRAELYDEPLQSDLHDEMREASYCSLLPEEISAIVSAYSQEEWDDLEEAPGTGEN